MLPGSGKIDGLQVVFFAKISDETIQSILNDKQTESIQLLQNFVKNSISDDREVVSHWRKKFKVTANMNNVTDVSLDFMVKKLASSNNGKSVVPDEKSSFYYDANKYFQIDMMHINYHQCLKMD